MSNTAQVTSRNTASEMHYVCYLNVRPFKVLLSYKRNPHQTLCFFRFGYLVDSVCQNIGRPLCIKTSAYAHTCSLVCLDERHSENNGKPGGEKLENSRFKRNKYFLFTPKFRRRAIRIRIFVEYIF